MTGGKRFVVGQDSIVALVESANEVIEIDGFAGSDNIFVASVLTVADVFFDATFEEPSVLEHHSEEIMDILTRKIFGADAVDFNIASISVVKLH